jgi:leader peptidase (prepilin peptidase) / N-methyltransferase
MHQMPSRKRADRAGRGYLDDVNAVQVALLVVLAAAVGSVLGSYAAVVAARGWRGSLEGRSRCDSCNRTLRWFELVPLLSYPALLGRCRTCRVRVPFSVYAWELGGAAIAVLVLVVGLVALGRH